MMLMVREHTLRTTTLENIEVGEKKISGGDENITNIFRALANLMKRFCIGYHTIYIEKL